MGAQRAPTSANLRPPGTDGRTHQAGSRRYGTRHVERRSQRFLGGRLDGQVHPPSAPPGHPGPLPHRCRQLLLMEQAPGGPQAQFNQNPRITQAAGRRVARALVPRARCRTRSASLREYGGWLGVWNCETAAACSPSRACPNFLPTALGGGTNGVIHGDFGYSISRAGPVIDLIVERVPATMMLMLTAFVIWVTIAVVLGVIAAVKRYSLFDQSVTLLQLRLLLAADVLASASSSSTSSRSAALVPVAGHRRPRKRPAAFNTPAVLDGLLGGPDPQHPGHRRASRPAGA